MICLFYIKTYKSKSFLGIFGRFSKKSRNPSETLRIFFISEKKSYPRKLENTLNIKEIHTNNNIGCPRFSARARARASDLWGMGGGADQEVETII